MIVSKGRGAACRGLVKSVGGCLISKGSGVLVRMRRDPHCDDGGVCLGVHSFGGDHHPSRLRGFGSSL